MRRSVSKKRRFDVFKRDCFHCQYCGRKPPAVVLELDHIVPVSKGGGNDEDNLLTSCFDCNRGKGSGELAHVPPSTDVRLSELKEREEQLRELRRWKAAAKRRLAKDVESIQDTMRAATSHVFTESFVKHSLTRFLSELDVDDVAAIMSRCVARWEAGNLDGINHFVRYFCFLCWKAIKGDDWQDGRQ